MRVASLLTDIAACLQVTLEDNDAADLCFIGVVPGDGVVQQYGFGCKNKKCGVAWVRMISSYPAIGIGIPDDRAVGCGTMLGLDIEVGIFRCIGVGDNRGNPLPPAQVLAAGERQADDMLLTKRALCSCQALLDVDYQLGAFLPFGPQGGLVGGAWQLSVAW